MQIIMDYYIVSIDQRYESQNIKNIITLNTAWVNDVTEERFMYKRLYGRVESCPIYFSEKLVYLIDPGVPTPRKYISGDYIQMRVNQGFKMDRSSYNPTTFEEYEMITMADIAKQTDIRRFDRVYFDPKVTEDENYLGDFEGKQLYKVSPNQVICAVRNGEVVPQGGWCLVNPHMETWEEITTSSGIIKKPHPEAKELEGTVCHLKSRYDLKEGDAIRYMHGADWKVSIEGREYYVIQEDDIICKVAS